MIQANESADDLAGEIITCLRANFLTERLTTQDDVAFEQLLNSWSERLQACRASNPVSVFEVVEIMEARKQAHNN